MLNQEPSNDKLFIIIPTHHRVMPTIIFNDIKGVSPSPLLDVATQVRKIGSKVETRS